MLKDNLRIEHEWQQIAPTKKFKDKSIYFIFLPKMIRCIGSVAVKLQNYELRHASGDSHRRKSHTVHFVAYKWQDRRCHRTYAEHFRRRSVFVTRSDREAHVFYRLHARGMHDKKTIIAHRRNHLRFRKARCGPCAGCQRYSACIAHRVNLTAPDPPCILYITWRKIRKKKKETLLR